MESTATSRSVSRAGFTLIEILFAIAVVGILIGLLVVGLTVGRRAAARNAGESTAAAMKLSATQFTSDFGFAIPLVKDYDLSKAQAGERKFPVYVPAPLDSSDAKILRHEESDPSWPGKPADVPAEYWDLRYSLASLPFYLVGVDETPLITGGKLPIDGVSGPGILRPNEDGTFQVPENAKKPNATVKRSGQAFGPYLDTGRSGAKVVRAGTKGERYEIRDGKENAFRYYRWLQGVKKGTKYVVEKPADMNVPKVVGDPEKDPGLRGATAAIVWCGPDGLYGDESLKVILEKLNLPDGTLDATAREKAISDNVVLVVGP